jgi:PAS domain S-box-containing protein
VSFPPNASNTTAPILVVGGSPSHAERLRFLFEGHGYAVTVAGDGAQALAAARDRPPSVVITDTAMPGMDGYALCQAVKSQERLKDTPVVLLTSPASPLDMIKGLESGADNFIPKPYDEAYLVSRIRHILSNRRLRETQGAEAGLAIDLAGQNHVIHSERRQLLDLLLSTYEQALRTNAELEERQKEARHSYLSLRGLYGVAEALNRADSERDVVEKALERAMELPGVRAGWISLREGESGFVLAAARGLPPALQAAGALEGSCLCRRRLLAGELDRVTNILECERLLKPAGDTLGLRYHAAVPLWIGDRVLGLMNLAGPEEGLFSEDDLSILYGVGNQIASGLERVRLHQHLEEEVAKRTAALTAEIAARERAQAELAEALREGQSIMETVPDVLYTLDLDGKLVKWNRRLESATGLSAASLRNSPLAALVAEEERSALAEAVRDAYQKGLAELTAHLLTRDGSVIAYGWTAAPLKDAGGQVVGLTGVGRDLSEHRRLEEQLRQSQKMEAVGQLAGGVAHDFNNLLMVITGHGELMRRRLGEDDPRRRGLEEMLRAAERAAALTHQLLAFSRKQVLNPSVIDLNAVVADMDKLLRRLIGEDVELVTSLAPGLGSVRADRTQIEQVVVNLAVNARDAMPRGGKLTLETANVELDDGYASADIGVRPGPYVMIAVSDTGLGMDEATRARIFEPFFTTKEPGRGTGLGLSTVHGIVKQSGGEIWVYSEPGRGTTFKVYVPRSSERAALVRPRPASAEAPRGSETVLLVEDDEPVRALVCEALEEHGYAVLRASNGGEGLLVAERFEGPIHLVVTDVVMPDTTGPELAERLATRRPEIRILFLSGYTDDAIVRHGLLAPGMSFLQKPFTPQALARRVREVLDAPP